MQKKSVSAQLPHAETRDRLIEAAERLFAAQGLDTVSMRQINREAGQRNTSSIHYYFGSREAIIEAVLEQRMSAINARRLGLIEGLKARGAQGDLKELVAVYARPLAEQFGSKSTSNAYIRFLAQAYASSEIDIIELARGRWDQSLDETARLIRACLPELPDAIVRQRLLNMFRGVVYVLADRERDILTGRDHPNRLTIDAMVDDLITTYCAALAAPVLPSPA